jgi:hypothetical protein
MHLIEQYQSRAPRVWTTMHHPIRTNEETFMSESNEDTGPVPFIQQLLDNPFLLLFLGVLIPMVVYTLWGVIDILTIPLAK